MLGSCAPVRVTDIFRVDSWGLHHVKNESVFHEGKPFADDAYMKEQFAAGKKGVMAVMKQVIKEKESDHEK